MLKRMVGVLLAIFLSVPLWGAALTDEEKYDITLQPARTDDVLIIIKVPTHGSGKLGEATLRPLMPSKIKKMKRRTKVLYLKDYKGNDGLDYGQSEACLVFVVVPKELEADMIALIDSYPYDVVERITPAKEAATAVAFKKLPDIKAKIADRIINPIILEP